MGSEWIAAVKARATVTQVVTETGGWIRRKGFGPCPQCGATQRGSEDRRGPCGLTRNNAGWRCFRCDEKGDAFSVASWMVGGAPWGQLARDRRDEVRSWLAERGWCDPQTLLPGERRARPVMPSRVASLPPPPPPEPEPVYPPVGEVRAVWAALRGLDAGSSTDSALCWLERWRQLSLSALAVMDMVRLLPFSPDTISWPEWLPWCGMSRPDWLLQYRIAAPLYDHTGALRSLRFRAVDRVPEFGDPIGGDPIEAMGLPKGMRWHDMGIKTSKKAINPKGYQVGGLVLADPLGVAVLRGEREHSGVAWDGRVVIMEGEADTWTTATSLRGSSTYAVLGVGSGAWSDAIAERVAGMVGTTGRVIVWTHSDPKGDEYAERIRSTLAGRCVVKRQSSEKKREEGGDA